MPDLKMGRMFMQAFSLPTVRVPSWGMISPRTDQVSRSHDQKHSDTRKGESEGIVAASSMDAECRKDDKALRAKTHRSQRPVEEICAIPEMPAVKKDKTPSLHKSAHFDANPPKEHTDSNSTGEWSWEVKDAGRGLLVFGQASGKRSDWSRIEMPRFQLPDIPKIWMPKWVGSSRGGGSSGAHREAANQHNDDPACGTGESTKGAYAWNILIERL